MKTVQHKVKTSAGNLKGFDNKIGVHQGSITSLCVGYTGSNKGNWKSVYRVVMRMV